MTKASVKKQKAAKPKGFPAEKAAELYRRLAKERPDPKTELIYKDPFTLVVAVALSAQATDVSVNKATVGLFKAANTPAKMVKLGEAGVAEHIRTIGLWRNKAKNVVALSQMILDRAWRGHTAHARGLGGAARCWPQDGERGVERGLWRGDDCGGHARVPRLEPDGAGAETTPEKVESLLLEVTPDKYRRGAHHWLILHGRYTCLARKPGCPECVIRDLCEYEAKTGE